MDYLDPKKKKAKRIQLLVGYALLGIAISITTLVFVYLANGYVVDRKTGEVIQNGVIYLDSRPESARVYMNGQQQSSNTDARLVVPEGEYSLELRRDGYKSWKKTFLLEGGTLRRLTYPRLIPEKLDTELAATLQALPTLVSQSNDKRWVVLAFNDNILRMQVIDLNRSALVIDELPLPVELIKTKSPGKWNILEWADDHRTFLAEYRTEQGVEYVLIDRSDPAKSKHLNTVFAAQPFSSISMRDRKNDLLYLFNNQTGQLLRANATTGQVEPYLEGVVDYTAYGNDAVLFVTKQAASSGMVKAVLKKGNQSYELREIHEDTTYLLELAKLGNAMVMGIGSAAENRVLVYNDPIHAIAQNDFSKLPVATTVLKVEKPQELTISADASVIVARSGQEFASHEFEADRSYVFTIEKSINLAQELRWMDGRHLMIGVESDAQLITDFDGNNQFILGSSKPELGSMFDEQIDRQITFMPPESSGGPVRLLRTYMRSAADR